VVFGPHSILRVFAYSFSLLSSFRFLGFVADVKLDLCHIAISGSLKLYLFFSDGPSTPASLAKTFRTSQVSPSDRSVNAKNFRYPQSLDAVSSIHLWLSCCSLLVLVLWLLFFQSCLVIATSCFCLALYRIPCFCWHVGPAFLCVFDARLYFTVCNWIGTCTL